MSRILIPLLACLFGGAAALAALPVIAADYDLDCAVILCLAAGFPAEPSGTCAEAFEHMIDRITDTPPKSPVGVCGASDGSEYAPAQVLFSQPSRQSRLGWICPDPSPMRFSERVDYTLAAPVCYPDAEHVPLVVQGGSGYWFLGARSRQSVSSTVSRSPCLPTATLRRSSRRSISRTPAQASRGR
ncbi:hypothetical protein CNY89_07330 [Amaricoccus sp. HAR-UPW-R2A-40]|nr:hypothetical protein CNY89_07330 [Amaricoccus sp. HAR-UPW-R2A-40]